jgi:hypothetical protein
MPLSTLKLTSVAGQHSLAVLTSLFLDSSRSVEWGERAESDTSLFSEFRVQRSPGKRGVEVNLEEVGNLANIPFLVRGDLGKWVWLRCTKRALPPRIFRVLERSIGAIPLSVN